MVNRRTVAIQGLFVLILALLWSGPAVAEDEPVARSSPSASSSPAPEAEATPPPRRPRTMGELFLGEGGGPSGGPGTSQTPSAEEPAYQGKFELSEPQPVPKHWATKGMVGQSTFFDRLIQVCWSLALVSLLVWVLAKVAEKAGFKELSVGGSQRSLIEIIEKKRLSPGRTIMLMRVGPKVLAVAATEKGYETLTEMDGEQFKSYQDSMAGSVDEPKPPSQTEGAMTPGDVLRHYLSIIPGTGAKK